VVCRQREKAALRRAHRHRCDMNEKLLQEAAMVMKTDFWKIYVSEILKKRKYVDDRYRDEITTQEQWIKHAVFQGELKAWDKILTLPEDILMQIRGDTR